MTKTRTRGSTLLLAIVVLSVFAMACNRLTEFTVTLRPPRVLQIVQTALDLAGVEVPIHVSGLEIHAGYIHAAGSHTDDEGKVTTGSVDMALGTQNGMLRAEIVSVDIQGVDLSADQIAGYNELLSREFNRAATAIPGVRIVSVETVEGAVRVRVKLGLGQ
jgi:hypothetical protein